MTSRRAGIWASNGVNPDTNKMYLWKPYTITVIYEYIGTNKVLEYKRANPHVQIIVRFIHPTNWRDELNVSANNWGAEIAGKWNNDPVLRELDPWIYIANEQNLWYESGGKSEAEQWSYFDTEAFYKELGEWWYKTHKKIKELAPDISLISPPLAYGHNEDGVFKNGKPSIGWAGYDYLQKTIKEFCDGRMCTHFYWGGSWGCSPEWLYGSEEDPELNTWHAFRWKKVLELFETRYGWTPKIMIDEAGNFDTAHPDFTDQLKYYTENTLNNPSILGLTYFLWYDQYNSDGNRKNDWLRFCPNIDKHLEVMKNTVVKIEEDIMTVPWLSYEESKDVINFELQEHKESGGKIVGSVCRLVPVQEAESRMGHSGLAKGDRYFKAKYVTFINEEQSAGGVDIFVAIRDKEGNLIPSGAGLFTYPSSALLNENWNGKFDNGGGNGQAFVWPTGQGQIAQGPNNFAPQMGSETVGPYCVAVAGAPSDWVAGFGLTGNRHIQYSVVFQESFWEEEDPNDPEDPNEPIISYGGDCSKAVAAATVATLRATNRLTNEEYLEALKIIFE